jgi:hypothetical protein
MGKSVFPDGVVSVLEPTSVVGEYWPPVMPYIAFAIQIILISVFLLVACSK